MISSLKFSSVLKVKDTIIIGFHDKRQTRAKEAARTAFFLQTVVISDSFQHDIYANVGDNELGHGALSAREHCESRCLFLW